MSRCGKCKAEVVWKPKPGGGYLPPENPDGTRHICDRNSTSPSASSKTPSGGASTPQGTAGSGSSPTTSPGSSSSATNAAGSSAGTSSTKSAASPDSAKSNDKTPSSATTSGSEKQVSSIVGYSTKEWWGQLDRHIEDVVRKLLKEFSGAQT